MSATQEERVEALRREASSTVGGLRVLASAMRDGGLPSTAREVDGYADTLAAAVTSSRVTP